jgi:hypothetical protein
MARALARTFFERGFKQRVGGVEWSGVEWSGVEWSGVEFGRRVSVDTAGLDRRTDHASTLGKKFLGRTIERLDEALFRLGHAFKVFEPPYIVSCWDERVLVGVVCCGVMRYHLHQSEILWQ